MIIFPAIDIRDGKCVRLTEGRFDQETILPTSRWIWRCAGQMKEPVSACSRLRWSPCRQTCEYGSY